MPGKFRPKPCQEISGYCCMVLRTKKWICQVLTMSLPVQCVPQSRCLLLTRELRLWLQQVWSARLTAGDAEEVQRAIKLFPLRVINSGAARALANLAAMGLSTPAWLAALAYELEAARDAATSHMLAVVRPCLEVEYRNRPFYATEAMEGIVVQLFLLEVRKRCFAPSIIWLHDGFWIDKQVDDGVLVAAERYVRSLLFPLSNDNEPLFRIMDLELYRRTCELITLCQTHQLLWSCENPGRSFMWQTTSFQPLFSTVECQSTQVHHCMYGSSRRKLTHLIHNVQSFHQLHQMCNNKHEHEPWGQKPDGSWATSGETAYPWLLARAIAAQVVIQLQEKGLICHRPSFAEQECTLQAMRAATNIQPRKNLPPLVPEFKQVIHQDAQAPLPPHARLLSTPKRGYVASAKESNDNQVTVGIHFSPEEFLNEAVRLCHPTEHNSLFPEEVRANVAHLSNNTVHQIALERTEEVKGWVTLSKELSAKERDLKSSISPRIAEVLKDKRLGLLERLLEEASHEDRSLVEVWAGVSKQKFRPASMTCEDLRKVSNLSRDVFLESVQSSGDKEVDISLFAATLKEVEKGFIKGPISREELPAGSALTKRFPCEAEEQGETH